MGQVCPCFAGVAKSAQTSAGADRETNGRASSNTNQQAASPDNGPDRTPVAPTVPVVASSPAAPETNGSSAPVVGPKNTFAEPVQAVPVPATAAREEKPSSTVDSTVSEVTTAAEIVPTQGLVLSAPPAWQRPKVAHLDESGAHEDSSEEEDNWMSTTAPLGPDGLPSLGSVGHAQGDCKRCCFHPKGRCSNGHECRFCHYDHDKRKRLKKKGKRSENQTPSSAAGIKTNQDYRGSFSELID
eukprot:TRINITY_DN19723_c0_g1_i1.p1 TRINITY_DN19723_c0_g1~~TRINITY_DN19723_c0_g1_i1.p1  ORF type:complete len:242 (-),score=40.17 TRINITY_DN19723_c0_g1_i1:24-749(-)